MTEVILEGVQVLDQKISTTLTIAEDELHVGDGRRFERSPAHPRARALLALSWVSTASAGALRHRWELTSGRGVRETTLRSAAMSRRRLVCTLPLVLALATGAAFAEGSAESSRPTSFVERLLADLPEEQGKTLAAQVAFVMAAQPPHRWRSTLEALIDPEDLQSMAPQLSGALIDATGLPESIARTLPAWGRVVHDGAVVFFGGLDPERLQEKVIDQILLPPDTTGGVRLATLIDRMPTLQKLGQIVARNPHLDESFRRELRQLENGLETADIDEVIAELEERHGEALARYRVRFADKIFAEATIAAVVRFEYRDPETNEPGDGLFKIVKPYVRAAMSEELARLDDVAAHFDSNRATYGLGGFRFGDVITELRGALEREIRIADERAQLAEAAAYFADSPEVVIPRPLPLADDDSFAMTFLTGSKLTDGCGERQQCRRRLAELVARHLILGPVIGGRAEDQPTIFHADPHAGNLIAVPGETADRPRLGVVDWGLIGRFDGAERGHLVQLRVGLDARDRRRVARSLLRLARDVPDPSLTAEIEQLVAVELARTDVTSSERMDRVVSGSLAAGLTLRQSLILYNKALITLKGVLHELDPEFKLDDALSSEVRRMVVSELPKRLLKTLTIVGWTTHDYQSGLSNEDVKDVGLAPVGRGIGAFFRAIGAGIDASLGHPGLLAPVPGDLAASRARHPDAGRTDAYQR